MCDRLGLSSPERLSARGGLKEKDPDLGFLFNLEMSQVAIQVN